MIAKANTNNSRAEKLAAEKPGPILGEAPYNPPTRPAPVEVRGAFRSKISQSGLGSPLSLIKPIVQDEITTSPEAFKSPIVTAATTPFNAPGRITRRRVNQRVAPRAKEASFSCWGTLRIAS